MTNTSSQKSELIKTIWYRSLWQINRHSKKDLTVQLVANFQWHICC